MELFSTRLDLWYGEYHYDPDEWEDDMEDIKWPANEAQALVISWPRGYGKTKCRAVYDSETRTWKIVPADSPKV